MAGDWRREKRGEVRRLNGEIILLEKDKGQNKDAESI